MANAFHSAGQSVGATSAGAILGSIENPYAAINLGGSITDLLTTGDLAAGDAGEMGGLPTFAVEFWFQTAALPVSNQTLIAGPLSNSGTTRQWAIVLNTTGTLSFTVIDDGTTLRGATTGSVLLPGTWNHIVISTAGTNLTLYLNGVSAANDSTWATHTVRSLGSTVGSLDIRIFGPGTLINQYYDELAIYRVSLPATRVAAHYTAGTAMGFGVQKPGTRIGAVLDSVSSHAPRNVQLGTRNVVERYMSGQSPLEEIRRGVEAEDVDAGFFVAADGTLVFLAANHRSNAPYTVSQLTVGEVASGSEIPYDDLKFDYSPTELINEWNVTRTTRGPVTPLTQTASDSTSINRYFKRSQSLSDVPVTNDSDASQIASALLTKTKDPMFRVTSVSFDLLDASVAEAVFRRELMDRITVKFTPPGGGARISQDVFIQRIDFAGDNSGASVKATWAVSPL